MARALVIGAGITGLACAFDLLAGGAAVTLVDPADRPGGKIRTERVDGFLIESGPDSFVSYRPAAAVLAGELGLADQIISTTEPRAVSLHRDGRMLSLPDGMGMVVPSRLGPFLRTGLLTWPQKLRAGLDLALPRSLPEADVSIGAFLQHRMGQAMVEQLADPLLAGVYGTSSYELSLDAVLPQLRVHEREHRSLLLAGLALGRRSRRAPAARAAGSARGRPVTGAPPGASPFRSLAAGMGSLVDTLADRLAGSVDLDMRLGRRVQKLERFGSHSRARLSDGAVVRAEVVVFTAPARPTRDLLAGEAPAAAGLLGRFRYGSTAVVSLGYDAVAFPEPLVGHGFLEAGAHREVYSGTTFSSQKWPGRAPDGAVLLRCFLPDRSAGLAAQPDAQVYAEVEAGLARALGVSGPPILRRLARWDGLMPKYTIGHLDRVAALERAMAAVPGWFLAGATFHGVGVPDCISSGRRAAAAALDVLSSRDGGDRQAPAESLAAGLTAIHAGTQTSDQQG